MSIKKLKFKKTLRKAMMIEYDSMSKIFVCNRDVGTAISLILPPNMKGRNKIKIKEYLEGLKFNANTGELI